MSDKRIHNYTFGQIPEMPWKKEKDVKYLRKLSKSILDDRNVFVEFLLAWIAACLTVLVVSVLLSLLS